MKQKNPKPKQKLSSSEGYLLISQSVDSASLHVRNYGSVKQFDSTVTKEERRGRSRWNGVEGRSIRIMFSNHMQYYFI